VRAGVDSAARAHPKPRPNPAEAQMTHPSRGRLSAALISLALTAGLALAVLPAAIAAPLATAPSPAPAGAGSASGFTFTMFPSGQAGGTTTGCTGLGRARDADPYIDRRDCGFSVFDVTTPTGAVTGQIIAEDGTVVATPAVVVRATDNRSQVSITPTDTWKPGRTRIVISDTTGPIGEFPFYYNGLTATVNTGAPSAPGDPISVTGTIQEHVGGTAPADGPDSGNNPVAAKYKVRTTDAAGNELDLSPELTAAGGAISYTVPGPKTAGVTAGPATDYHTVVKVSVVDASFTDTDPPPPTTGAWKGTEAGTAGHTLEVTPTELTLTNSFVSSVGWVKPGESYPSSITLTNSTAGPLTRTVEITAPTGSTILTAGGTPVNASTYTWSPGVINPDETKNLVLESKAAPFSGAGSLDTIVWRDLSSTAVLKNGGTVVDTKISHGPKVIPPNERFDTARYGDRPFPVVPVQYNDRSYQSTHSGSSLGKVLNDPSYAGSTFNLYQEMSLRQLFPHGTVPSEGQASADFTDTDTDEFTTTEISGPTNTCHGSTYSDLPVDVAGTPLYPERITNGVYNLPGNTDYYGDDSGGSAVATSQAPAVGFQDIDSACGDTGKLVYDSAILADPEIDYSDYDTDKDGVVDFFMVVFAGCGGNGASQVPILCPYGAESYDNIWPHSSSLEFGYSDPVTGLPGLTTDDQLKNLEGQPLWYQSDAYDITKTTTTPGPDNLKVFVRVGPYNVNPETAIDKASVISHEYGHSLGLPDFYTTSGRETYGDWNLMATDKSQNMDAFSRQELGWVVPEVLTSTHTETNITGSKVDTGKIIWKKPNGDTYELNNGGDGIVHNSKMFVAKLPGRQLLDPAVFDQGDKASPTHLWWSGSGNDYGCTPDAGHNLDIAIPGLKDLTSSAKITLSMKSRWDIEWDYDYGFVLTTKDGGKTYTSHPSTNGYTTGTNTVPPAKSNNSCQDKFSNGLTGTSGSYAAGTENVDRNTNNYPPPEFVADSFDISDLAGATGGALRLSYATDPGLARPGWFIDDLKVTVDPDGAGAAPAYDAVATDFETSGGPTDPVIFNGGCRESISTATRCTQGWKYLQAGTESDQDHAYYMEMRDRSGFDFDGRGQIDRDPIGWTPGFYLSYTDESHGYGNAGTDDPPAQSPLDSAPEAGNNTPNLNDAAFVDGGTRAAYSDAYVEGDAAKKGHTDNYLDPTSPTGNWEFRYNCLGFNVDSMTGEDTNNDTGLGDLTGNVTFTMGSGCGAFDYGYTTGPSGGGGNTAPVAKATATPSTAKVGSPVTLSAAGTTDAETPDALDYSWDFGNGGTTKDATGKTVKVAYANAGTFTPKVTVTDPQGLNGTASTSVNVTRNGTGPKAVIKIKPKHPGTDRKTRFVGKKSTGVGKLKYKWNFHNGGKKVDARGKKVKTFFRNAGRHRVTLTVIDSTGASDKVSKRFRVRHHFTNRGGAERAAPEELFRLLF
jgi:M6 family metalloprotease-like protein